VKGIVFVELAAFVERHAGVEMLEEALEEVASETGGAYTSVGNYSHQEAVDLVLEVARRMDTPAPDMMRQFGFELTTRFAEMYPEFFENISNSREFLRGIHSHIHVEVRKLYADAKPPAFDVIEDGDNMTLVYSSHRPMAMLGLGLVEGSIEYFGDDLVVTTDPVELTYETSARYFITKR